MRAIGPHVAEKLCEIVKLRNKLARSLGYEDFYDYKVTPGCHPHTETSGLTLPQPALQSKFWLCAPFRTAYIQLKFLNQKLFRKCDSPEFFQA